MTRYLAALVLAFAPSLAAAQQHPHAATGPSESFGTVHFPTSCKPQVSQQFDKAVAVLHSFEFGQSLRGFGAVLAGDSTCAMARWGMAISRWSNPMAAGNRSATLLQEGLAHVTAARQLAGNTTARERGYIEAVAKLYDDFEHKDQRTRVAAYEQAMNELAHHFPEDTEAKIFHAIALVAAASPTDKSYANQLRAGATLESLWAKQPNHPGLAHYIIHAYDYPPLAAKSRAAALRYSQIAPSAAHALHMPSHTFTRVGLWEKSIAANKRSADVALTNGSIAEALHAADYAMYANLQLGNYTAARKVLNDLPGLAARFDPKAITGAAPPLAGVFAIAAIPARWALERRAWKEAAALEPVSTDYPYAEAMTYFARALGASHTRDLTKARSAIDSLQSIQQRLAARNEAYWAEQVAIQALEAQAWLDLAEHRNDQALAKMREAVAREDATEKNAVTPGPLAPARELLGDMLASLQRRKEARAAYKATLVKDPNRRHSMKALQRLGS